MANDVEHVVLKPDPKKYFFLQVFVFVLLFALCESPSFGKLLRVFKKPPKERI
jgi:hypothetical protein